MVRQKSLWVNGYASGLQKDTWRSVEFISGADLGQLLHTGVLNSKLRYRFTVFLMLYPMDRAFFDGKGSDTQVIVLDPLYYPLIPK